MKTIDITYRYEELDAPTRPRPRDSAAALSRLNDGNRAFAMLLEEGTRADVEGIISIDRRELGLGHAKLPEQHPFAAIVGCADARVPVELIFNEGPNDLFVVRIAGNGLGPEVLGSLKYAVDHLGESLKLIVVLGHSGCGALSAAVDGFLNPTDYLPLVSMPSLRHLIDRLLVVVQASARKIQTAYGPEIANHPRYREALVEASIVTNAALAAYTIQQELDASDTLNVQAAYGIYLIETRQVWAPHGHGLASAPRDRGAFLQSSDAILQSDRFKSLLQPL